MIHTEYDMPVDPLLVKAMRERVTVKRPLTGGRVQEQGKRLYCAPDDTPLSEARKAADALIIRRGGKLPRNREQYVSKAWTEKAEAS